MCACQHIPTAAFEPPTRRKQMQVVALQATRRKLSGAIKMKYHFLHFDLPPYRPESVWQRCPPSFAGPTMPSFSSSIIILVAWA